MIKFRIRQEKRKLRANIWLYSNGCNVIILRRATFDLCAIQKTSLEPAGRNL